MQSYPPVQYRGGGAHMEPLPRVFYMLRYFEKISPPVESFNLLNKMSYILWVVGLLEICNVTKHGRRVGSHLELCPELEIR